MADHPDLLQYRYEAFVGATVAMAVERRASVLGRSAPSRSKGLSAAHPRRWAA